MIKMFEKTTEYKEASHQRREAWGLRLREVSHHLKSVDSSSTIQVLPDCRAGIRPCFAAFRSVERSMPCSTLSSLMVFIENLPTVWYEFDIDGFVVCPAWILRLDALSQTCTSAFFIFRFDLPGKRSTKPLLRSGHAFSISVNDVKSKCIGIHVISPCFLVSRTSSGHSYRFRLFCSAIASSSLSAILISSI